MEDRIIENLKKAVERVFGHNLSVRSDFDNLTIKIHNCIHENLSSTTIRRFWGYQTDQEYHTSKSTLNILSRYCGFKDYDSFKAFQIKKTEADGEQSHFSNASQILSSTLDVGKMLRLTWNPGRVVTVRYEGDDSFTVLESVNSKLSVGIRFSCQLFLDGEPLTICNLSYQGKALGSYICGQKDGVRVTVLD